MKRLLALLSLASFAVQADTHPQRSESFEILDPAFSQVVDKNARLDILSNDLEWGEGPVWSDQLNALLFSDIAVNKVYRWDETQGLTDYLYPSGHPSLDPTQPWRGANGLAINSKGELLLAQQGTRTFSKMNAPLNKPTASFELLADHYQDKKLNSPNDVVVHRSGDLYFTDPPYGLPKFEKDPGVELPFFGVFKLSTDGQLTPVVKDLVKPNGIALSHDQNTLYVSDSQPGVQTIYAYGLDEQGQVDSSRVFLDAKSLEKEGPGGADGMAVLKTEYLFVSIPNGLALVSPEGKMLGKIGIGQVTNMTLNGDQSQLFITTPKQLLRLGLKPE